MEGDQQPEEATASRPSRSKRPPERYSVSEDVHDVPVKRSKTKIVKQREVRDEKSSFKCAECSSQFITNPSKMKKKPDPSRPLSRRKRVNSETGEIEYLCNACGIRWSRLQRGCKPTEPPKPKGPLSEETKRTLISEGEAFAQRIFDDFLKKDSKESLTFTKLLFCARLLQSTKPPFVRLCACIQTYILGPAAQPRPVGEIGLPVRLDPDELAARAEKLIEIASEAAALKNSGGLTKRRCEAYEDYVKTWRHKLKEEWNLCEGGCQKLLGYSNNFLHKPLKKHVEPGVKRIRKMKEDSELTLEDKLVPVLELPERECCGWHCTKLAKIHPKLIQRWRDDSTSGSQSKKREVVKLMSFPVAGGAKNCSNFIRMVTGVCYATIAKVQKEIYEGLDVVKKFVKKKVKAKLKPVEKKTAESREVEKNVEGDSQRPSVAVEKREVVEEDHRLVNLAERLPSFSAVINGNISTVQFADGIQAGHLLASQITFALAVDEHAALSTSDNIPLASLQPSVLEECPGVGVEATSSNRSLDFEQYFHNIQTEDVPTLTSFVLLNDKGTDSQ